MRPIGRIVVTEQKAYGGYLIMKEKVILAYSGGLDTTAIIPWLKENFNYEVVCVCIDCGQGEELKREPNSAALKNYTYWT